MRRELGFGVAGVLMIAFGGVLVTIFGLPAGGPGDPSAYLVAGASVVVGVLFLAAARDARRYRLTLLRAAEDGSPLPDDGLSR